MAARIIPTRGLSPVFRVLPASVRDCSEVAVQASVPDPAAAADGERRSRTRASRGQRRRPLLRSVRGRGWRWETEVRDPQLDRRPRPRVRRRVSSGGCFLAAGQAAKGLTVVPWQPGAGPLGHGRRVAHERREVVEGVAAVELGGVNDRHVDVADLCPALAAIKQGVVAVPDGHLQRSFDDVVVDRSAGHTQEERELIESA